MPQRLGEPRSGRFAVVANRPAREGRRHHAPGRRGSCSRSTRRTLPCAARRRLAGDRGRRARRSDHRAGPEGAHAGPRDRRRRSRRGRPPARDRTPASGSSIRSTAPRNSSAATASSPSTSRSSKTVRRCSASVLAPALGRLFAGIVGQGAFVEDAAGRHPIECRVPPAEGLTVVASRSHGDASALDAFLGGRKVAALKKRRLVAEALPRGERRGRSLPAPGPHDGVGHRRRPTRCWQAAGGRVTDLSGAPLGYGKPGFDNPHFVAAAAADRGSPQKVSPAPGIFVAGSSSRSLPRARRSSPGRRVPFFCWPRESDHRRGPEHQRMWLQGVARGPEAVAEEL